ncbi:unnamed protein product [Macrosiphum euphorbiae]|uniref:Uncharacterized protein n=1 Tax=Macrosiphum euphorbiae TaxID=13131 RepID=A0AAV0VYS6_9HEMI|nr:unnamed protein product [Macrosiphum euphorbiae]
MNLQANEIRFPPMEPTGHTGQGSATGLVPDASQTAQIQIETSHSPPRITTNNTTTQPSTTPTHQQTMGMIQTGRTIIKEVRQAVENSAHGCGLESRLTMLENCMARFGEDQRRIAETMRRLEMGMARQAPEQQPDATPPIRPHHTVLSNNTEYGARYPAPIIQYVSTTQQIYTMPPPPHTPKGTTIDADTIRRRMCSETFAAGVPRDNT